MNKNELKLLEIELASAIRLLKRSHWKAKAYLLCPLSPAVFTFGMLGVLHFQLITRIVPAMLQTERAIQHLHQTRERWENPEPQFAWHQSRMNRLETEATCIRVTTVILTLIFAYALYSLFGQQPLRTYQLQERLTENETIRCFKLAKQLHLPDMTPTTRVDHLLRDFQFAYELIRQHRVNERRRFALISTGLFAQHSPDTQRRIYHTIFKHAGFYTKPANQPWLKNDRSVENNLAP